MKAMLRYVLCSNVLFLGAALAQAQPCVAGGPGIAGTMAFIQETLNSQGAVSSDAEIARVGVFDALADARACTLSLGTTRQFHVDNADDITVTKSGKKSKKARSEPSQLHVDNLTAKLSFRDVEKLIVAPIGDPGSQALLAVAVDGHAISRSEQPIFLLIVSMTEKVNATGHATGPKNMTKGGARGAGSAEPSWATENKPWVSPMICVRPLLPVHRKKTYSSPTANCGTPEKVWRRLLATPPCTTNSTAPALAPLSVSLTRIW